MYTLKNVIVNIDYIFKVNGTITLNENLADNGGTKESYRAMKKVVGRLNLKDSSKFSTDQQFFLGFGTVSKVSVCMLYLID